MYVSLGPLRTCIDARIGEVEILGTRSSVSDDRICEDVPIGDGSVDDEINCGRRGVRSDIERACPLRRDDAVLEGG